MPVPSPRNSIRVARGNYADLLANVNEIGEGELCFALDQDRFYSKSGINLVPVGGGTELYSIDQLGDVDITTVPAEAGQVLGYNGTAWVPTENEGTGSTLNSTRYRYESDTNIDSVASSKVRFNNTDFSQVTEIAFSNIDKNGVNIQAILQNMVDEHYSVYFQQEDNASKAVIFHFTGGASNVGDAVRTKFPVEYVADSGSALTSGKDCYTVFSAQAVGDAVTSVNGQQGAVVLDAADVGAIAPGEVNPVYFANQAAFPDASANHGAVAHSHADGAMFFAHGGTWNRLANFTEIPSVNNISLASLDPLP